MRCFVFVVYYVFDLGVRAPDSDAYANLTKLLRSLVESVDCPALKRWYLRLTMQIVELVKASAEADDFIEDPTKAPPVAPGRDAKLRIDEDVKRFVLRRVAEGRASTCASLLRALGEDELSDAASRKWEGLDVMARMHAMRRVWGPQPGTVSIATDASRFGCPAEETMAYACWHCDSGTAMWLPAQATRGS